MRTKLILLIACLIGNAAAENLASIEGTVTLPVARKAAPVKIQRYSVVTEGGVVKMSPALAIVYLEGDFPVPKGRPTVTMAQKDVMFETPLLPVQVGTTVEFPNYDDIYHNIFSYSKPKRFDLGRYLKSETPVPSQVFDKEGLVSLHCEIHAHMRAIVLVLPTPYFVKTDAAGRYSLKGLPAGDYTLKAWIDSKTTLSKKVTLSPGKPLTVNFEK